MGNLNCKSLMIGDWVNYKGRYNQIALADFGSNHLNWIKELKPIPLTTEILEKNGFVKLGKQYDIWSGRGFGFSLRLVDGVFGYYEQGHPYHPTFITKYVHELQHALRLFGLNEMADNFKI